VNVDGRRVAVHTVAEGGRKTVVWCHGAPGAGNFDPDPAATRARDVTLIGVDRPGYGGSDPMAGGQWCTVGRAADDLAEVLRRRGDGPAGVVGWSSGGRVAMALAARHPELVDRVAVVATPAPDENVPWLGDELSRPHPSYLRRNTTRRKDDVMNADTRLEELGLSSMGVSSWGEVDEPAFSGLAERHRRELHVHCYRMLGSFEDAEDTVQETFLRAWRRRETFEGRSTLRAWLYRIATNACLDLLAQRRPEPAAGGEVRWLQPYPDRLLDELPAADADEPETVAVARETIELAYLVAVQHLAPRPRAVLILRDVLGWPAKDVAEALGDSVNSVNSALQRARAGMREHLPAERQDWTGGEEDAGTRELVRRFTEASLAKDIDGLAALLRDDVRCSMPPTPGLCVGRDAVVSDWVESGFEGLGHLRAVLTSVNRQPAIAFYLWREGEGAYRPLTIDVLRVTGGTVTEIVIFHDDQFPRLGLPERLPAAAG
jgi:RNA polymerase sigma-70 factor (ECF subfamily)